MYLKLQAMNKEKFTEQLSGILPNDSANTIDSLERKKAISQAADNMEREQTAAQLAKIKRAELARLSRLEAAQAKKEELGLPSNAPGDTATQVAALEEQRRRVAAIEALEEEERATLNPIIVTAPSSVAAKPKVPSVSPDIMALQSTTRTDMARLLTSLNINLSVQLSKTDTANLLACLLTCNESQLIALQANKKVPVVIKTIIKRLLEDAKLGNIDTVERIWDRVFGKGAMQLNMPDQNATIMQGIIPNTPISREAYVVIRDTIIK